MVKSNIEIWKDIEGYEGLYQVSSLGRVKNIKTNKLIIPALNGYGYLMVALYDKNSRESKKSVHKLVAQAFIANPNNYHIVDHKDENKLNNVVSNLEWSALQYNFD